GHLELMRRLSAAAVLMALVTGCDPARRAQRVPGPVSILTYEYSRGIPQPNAFLDGQSRTDPVEVIVDNVHDAPPRDSPKENWGRVTPIVDTNHPNLYYNQSEIDELRQMVLVAHAPQHLRDRYDSEIKDAIAVKTIPDNKNPHHANMKAALSYAI